METLLYAIGKNELIQIVQPVIDVCEAIVPTLLVVVGALGGIWCIDTLHVVRSGVLRPLLSHLHGRVLREHRSGYRLLVWFPGFGRPFRIDLLQSLNGNSPVLVQGDLMPLSFCIRYRCLGHLQDPLQPGIVSAVPGISHLYLLTSSEHCFWTRFMASP